MRTCHEGGCGCVSGRNGEPATEPGRHPPGGDLRVLLAALRERDPVQESKSAPFGPPWRWVKEKSGLRGNFLSKLQTRRSHGGNSLTINHLSPGSTWVEHSLFLFWLLLLSSSSSFPASRWLHYHDFPSAGDGR